MFLLWFLSIVFGASFVFCVCVDGIEMGSKLKVRTTTTTTANIKHQTSKGKSGFPLVYVWARVYLCEYACKWVCVGGWGGCLCVCVYIFKFAEFPKCIHMLHTYAISNYTFNHCAWIRRYRIRVPFSKRYDMKLKCSELKSYQTLSNKQMPRNVIRNGYTNPR